MPARSDDADSGQWLAALGLSRPGPDDISKLLGTLLLFALGVGLLAASVSVLLYPDQPRLLLGWTLLMGGVGALVVAVKLFPLRRD